MKLSVPRAQSIVRNSSIAFIPAARPQGIRRRRIKKNNFDPDNQYMKTLPQKILLILIGRLGDFIVATSFIRSLRRNMPKAEITLITSRRAYHTALSDPNLDKVRLLSDAAFFWRNLKFAGFIFQKHDLLIDLNPSYSRASMALAAISGAVRKIAFAKKDPLGIYDLLIPHDPDNDYFWDKYARLAAETGITYEEGMRIYHDPGDEQKASDIIGALNIAGGMKPVAIHAGDFKKYDNRWPEEKFVELTGLLKTIPGIEPVYIIGPKEENATHNGILRHLPGTKYILPHSVPVLSCILKKTSA